MSKGEASAPSGPVEIRVVRKGELRAPDFHAGFDDPERVVAFRPGHLDTLVGNPHSDNDDDPAQILAIQSNTVLGRIDLYKSRATLAGERLNILWGSCWTVPERFRSTMAGLKVFMKWMSLIPPTGAAAVVGVSQVALPIYLKLGWTAVPMPRRILLRRSRAVVDRYIGFAPARPIARVALDVGLGASAWLASRGRPASDLTISVESTPPDDLAELFTHRAAFDGVVTEQSPERMRWLLEGGFGVEPRAERSLIVARSRDGRPAAYALTRVRLFETATHRQFKNVRIGGVLASWGVDPETHAEIYKEGVRRVLAAGTDAVDLSSHDASLTDRYRALGAVGAGELAFLFKPGRESPLADERFKAASSWRVSPSDGDNFFP
ncbi:MAG: hypothetical protein AAGK04_06770 [Planctomycetota bacterium]